MLLIALGCVAALAAVALLGTMGRGMMLKNSKEIFPNVCVSGVNIGGYQRDAAIAELDSKLAETHAQRTLTVQLPDRKLVFDPAMANSPLDTAAMVDAALAYGRDGSSFQVLKTYLDCKKSAYILDMQEYMQIDTEYIRQMIDKTAQDVAREMVQSQVTVDEEAQIIRIQLGCSGRKLDADKLYQTVLSVYQSGNLTDIDFSYDMIPYDIVDLQPYYSKYCTSARDAYYDETTRSLVEEVVGYGFDLMAANQRLALAEENAMVEIPLEVIKPQVTLASLKQTYFSDKLSSVKSYYNSGVVGRTTNLKLACQAIDGTVLNPGEIFSFNQIVGERTAEKGYQKGIIFTNDGASEAELGGGVCQVASTIYYATLLADLEVVERKPHMYTVDYVPMGMDAAIYWGSLDYKFKNNNKTPIMIHAKAEQGYVTIEFTGTMEHDYTVKMEYSIMSTIEPEVVEEVDETKPIGYRQQVATPYTGYVVWSYMIKNDLNGKQISRKKYAISEYNKRDTKFIVGPEPEIPEFTIPDIPTIPGIPGIDNGGGSLNGGLFG